MTARPVLAVTALLLVAACNGHTTAKGTPSASGPSATTQATPTDSPTPAGPATPPDPCTLLTKPEANTLAGVTNLMAPTDEPAGAPTTCTYDAPPTGSTAQVQILDDSDGALQGLTIDRDNLKHAFTQPKLGDEAWLEDDTLFLRKGTQWVEISLVLLNDAKENAPRLLVAGALVAGRLP